MEGYKSAETEMKRNYSTVFLNATILNPLHFYSTNTKWMTLYLCCSCNITGSFPSIASIHSLLLASDSACRVMTPCLQQTQRLFLLTHNPAAWQHLYTVHSWDTSPSPLHHLNVEAEAFVYGISLSSDAGAQPEHLWSPVHQAILRRETVDICY